jgi:hypothetical protein
MPPRVLASTTSHKREPLLPTLGSSAVSASPMSI